MSLGSQHANHDTSSTVSAPSTDSASHDDHSSSSGGGHSTIFNTATMTSLFSAKFTPQNDGQYAGMIIFLIVLTVIYRGLAAYKSTLEQKWAHKSRSTVVLIAGKNDGEEGVVEKAAEEPTEARNADGTKKAIPFRLSTEVPRAAFGALNAGVGYLM